MERMTLEQFREYVIDTIKDANPEDLERIGRAAIGPDLRYVALADGFEIADDTTPDEEVSE